MDVTSLTVKIRLRRWVKRLAIAVMAWWRVRAVITRRPPTDREISRVVDWVVRHGVAVSCP